MRVFFLFLMGFLIIGCSPDDEASIDLTTDIVGEYRGAFSSDLDNIDPFDVMVVKVDDDTVEIQPSDGNSFLEVTVDLESSDETSITNQPNQQYETTASFSIGSPTTLNFNIDPTGFNASFSGTKI